MATPTLPVAPLHPDLSAAPSAGAQLRSGETAAAPTTAPGVGGVALNLLRLALGVEFLWAFFDKSFGLGYATPSAGAWIHGGSPTEGFLSGVSAGPLHGVFNSIAGNPLIDWVFMLGLLGIGTALVLGVALRAAAASGTLLLAMMWFATWPPATMAGGQPTGSNNPMVDDHVISALALIVVAVYAAHSAGYLGRWWAKLDLVQRSPWLR
jgi:thiosulfate dehydrogenase (quinone) large subunit